MRSAYLVKVKYLINPDLSLKLLQRREINPSITRKTKRIQSLRIWPLLILLRSNQVFIKEGGVLVILKITFPKTKKIISIMIIFHLNMKKWLTHKLLQRLLYQDHLCYKRLIFKKVSHIICMQSTRFKKNHLINNIKHPFCKNLKFNVKPQEQLKILEIKLSVVSKPK